MKNRPAFELKLVMFLYNLLAVGLSAYMFIKVSIKLQYRYTASTKKVFLKIEIPKVQASKAFDVALLEMIDGKYLLANTIH